MYNLYRNNEIVFTGNISACLDWLQDKDIEYSTGLVFHTYEDVRENRPATYYVKQKI